MERKLIKLRNRIIYKSKEILKFKDDYVILDTETTGLGKNDVLLQIGIIDLDGNVLMDTLVRPSKRKRFSTAATDIHGITMKLVQNAPTFREIYPEFKKAIGKKVMLIYNAPFDARIIEQTMAQDGFELDALNARCVMNLYSGYVGAWSDYHNSIKWQRLPGGDHSAIGDCQATLKVIKKIANSEIEQLPKRWWEFWL